MENKKYCLLRQACYDLEYGMVDGYELLLRELVNDEWQVPTNFSLLSPDFSQNL